MTQCWYPIASIVFRISWNFPSTTVSRNNIEPCSDKTVMQVMCTKDIVKEVDYLKKILINGTKIKFKSNTEHVGIVSSVNGNLPNILQRISSHKAAVGAVLGNSLVKHHRANQAAHLREEQMHGTPVLLSTTRVGQRVNFDSKGFSKAIFIGEIQTEGFAKGFFTGDIQTK